MALFIVLVVALVVIALVLVVGKHNLFVVYGKMVYYAAFIDLVVVIFNKSLLLFILGFVVVIGFKMNLFNIGVDG